jgi:ectoine hydroxylase-related dioxygenase (phytanoyl-CoA dioxygenase family)
MLDVATDGCEIVDGLVSGDVLGPVVRALDTAAGRAGAAPERKAGLRDLFRAVPQSAALARHEGVRSAVERVLGPRAFVVRAILFDKTAESNWAVPWHQDTTIAVLERRDVPGFGPWSVKGGIAHVQPPGGVLEGMLTVRINIDPCGPENAPLLVVPRSHTRGIMGDDAVARLVERGVEPVACTGTAGDAVLMRPLIVHCSGRAEEPRRRRVVHLEWAAERLPGGLEWARA